MSVLTAIGLIAFQITILSYFFLKISNLIKLDSHKNRQELYSLVEIIRRKEVRIMSELAVRLQAIQDQLSKASAEIQGKIAELKAALDAIPAVPTDALDKLAALEATAKALDDIVPDAPVA